MPKILLVEDDNNLREIFQMRLQAEGYTTVTAADGEEGLVVAIKEKPDLIIADVMMPKLSGFEMIENLRSAPEMKGIKVVMMTALGQAEDQARGEKLGVVKYLVKSQVTLEDFARVVKEVLGPGSPQVAVAATQVVSSSNNNQESEKSMQEDTTPTNPAPVGDDTPAPTEPTAPSTNPISGDQQSASEEQQVVKDQVNDFVSSAPAEPSAPVPSEPATPAGMNASSAPPVSEPPAAPSEPSTPVEPAPEQQSGSTPPVDPTSNAL